MTIEVLDNSTHPFIDSRIKDKGEHLTELSRRLGDGSESVIKTVVINVTLYYHYIYKSNGHSKFVQIIVTNQDGNLVDALNGGCLLPQSTVWSLFMIIL